ncbi:MAG: 4Fe-4S dicluster domain-containing protein [Methanobrevibacter sp.]
MRRLQKIIVQRDLCDGCKDCERSCEALHGTSRINIIEFDGSYYPILCQQCQDPACEVICPTGAMTNTGIDSDKCIACGLCSLACPFGSIIIYDKSSEKCNRCADRPEGPACVQACSKRAISLVDTDKLVDKKREEYIAKVAGKSNKQNKSMLNVLTSGSRISKAFED